MTLNRFVDTSLDFMQLSSKPPKPRHAAGGGQMASEISGVTPSDAPVKSFTAYHVTKRENVDQILKGGFDITKVHPQWTNDYAISLNKGAANASAYFSKTGQQLDEKKYALLEVKVKGRLFDSSQGSTPPVASGGGAKEFTRQMVKMGYDGQHLGTMYYIHNPKAITHIREVVAPVKKIRGAADVQFTFDETNPAALSWAKQHAADLVAGISEATRDEIRSLIEDVFDDVAPAEDLSARIADTIGDDARAETIARTETMRASNEGVQESWDQAVEEGLLTGKEQQVWIVTPDDRLCPICEPLDGVTAPLDGEFESDGETFNGPPAHPNCRCTVGLQP